MGGVILPTSVATSATWQLVDFLSRQQTSVPASGGVAALDLGQVDGGSLWLIDHAVVHCDSSTPTVLRWYDSAVDPLRLLDGSDVGNFGVADWPQGLQVREGSSLYVVWEGAADGAVGTVTVQGRVLRRS